VNHDVFVVEKTPIAGQEALEDRCEQVKELISSFATSWFVEFAGMPRSGKSGCIKIVEHFLDRNGFAVLAPSEGAIRLPDFIKDSGDLLAYNVWTATYAIREILEGRFRRPNKYDFVILDRGLFDAMAWFHLLENKKKLEEDERKFMTEFMRVSHWSALIKQVFLLFCSPEKSIQREFKDKLTTKHGATTNETFLKELCVVYKEVKNCYSEDFRKIIEIDTDSLDQKQVAFLIVKNIFDDVESEKEA